MWWGWGGAGGEGPEAREAQGPPDRTLRDSLASDVPAHGTGVPGKVLVQRKVLVQSLSRVRLLATPWTVAHQAPPSVEFSRQEYWSGLPCPPPGELPKLGIEPVPLCLLRCQAGSLPLAPPGKPSLVLSIL